MSVLYLFDIDGTLLDAHRSGREAFDAVFEALHGVTDASNGIRYGGKTDPAIVDEIYLARLGRAATDAEHAAFLDAYLPRLHGLLGSRGVDVYAGVVETLAWLAGRADSVLGIATGNVRAGAQAKLAAAGLEAWFSARQRPSAVASASRGGAGDPLGEIPEGVAIGGYGCDSRVRAELVAKAVERGRAGREVREVVVVGDTVHDIAAARACGATVCAVATGSDPADALAHADAVFASLSELPAWHARRFG